MDKITKVKNTVSAEGWTAVENAIYNAIVQASNTTAKRGTIMGTGEIFAIMREYGLAGEK